MIMIARRPMLVAMAESDLVPDRGGVHVGDIDGGTGVGMSWDNGTCGAANDGGQGVWAGVGGIGGWCATWSRSGCWLHRI